MMRRRHQSGNAVIFILLGIALFAALTYSFDKSMRGGTGTFDKQKGSLTATEYKACVSAVEMADVRLQQRGCAGLVSREVDGSNPISGAPTDGSCSLFHPNGGNVKPCVEPECPSADLNALAIGESCEGIIYIGTSGGRRLYTTPSSIGNFTWASGSFNTNTGASSTSDGMSNTNSLIASSDAAAPYNAAVACRNLGPKWYLPSSDELILLSTNSNTGELAGSYNIWSRHWTSTEHALTQAYSIENNGSRADAKSSSYEVRCVRRN
jgi:hypothetical protein